MDLIDRQEAIDEFEKELSGKYNGREMAIGFVGVKSIIDNLPSAQPNLQPTCNQLATDCISRQAALDAIRHIREIYFNNLPTMIDKASVQTELMMLPSAQPEIIRCKDCKWKSGSECTRFADVRPFPDDFCSRGERIKDGFD